MQKRVQRYACQFADCVLVNADAVKDWLIAEGYDAVEDRRHPQRRRPDRGSAAPPTPSGIRRELGLPPGTPLVAVVSRLTRLKGLEQFLEAAAVAQPRYPDARFLDRRRDQPERTRRICRG